MKRNKKQAANHRKGKLPVLVWNKCKYMSEDLSSLFHNKCWKMTKLRHTAYLYVNASQQWKY